MLTQEVIVMEGAVARSRARAFCDGLEHTFPVRVEASQGVFRPGDGRALTFANVEHDGIGTAGVDDRPVQIVG